MSLPSHNPVIVDVLTTGIGAGASYVYDGESSSSFVVRQNGKPLLLLDAGVGAVRAALQHAGSLPDNIYISHNHTDHAGELPVLLAVEAQKGHKMTVWAERGVLATLITHRLHELQSTGRPLSDFGTFMGCAAGQLQHLGGGLSLMPLQARHAERCFGALLYWQGSPVLGWSGDSGYDAALYAALAAAPVVLLDGRARGTSEHAGFAQIAAAASSGIFGSSQVFVYGYGCQHSLPPAAAYPCLKILAPGAVIQLAAQQLQDADNPAVIAGEAHHNLDSPRLLQQQQGQVLQPQHSSAVAATAGAAQAAAEARAAASAAALAANVAAVTGPREIMGDRTAMQSAARPDSSGGTAGANGAALEAAQVELGQQMHEADLAARTVAGWAAAAGVADCRRNNGMPRNMVVGSLIHFAQSGGHLVEQLHTSGNMQDEDMTDAAVCSLNVPQPAAAWPPPPAEAAAAANAGSDAGGGCVGGGTCTIAGYPGHRQQQSRQQQHIKQQQQQALHHTLHRVLQQQQHGGHHHQQQQSKSGVAALVAEQMHHIANLQQQQQQMQAPQQRRRQVGNSSVPAAPDHQLNRPGVSSTTSTSSCTAA